MKHIPLLFFFLSINLFFSQEYTIKYQYTTEKDSVEYELFISKQKSVFSKKLSINPLLPDSLNGICEHFLIINDFKRDQLKIKDNIDKMLVSINLKKSLVWSIGNEKKNILGYVTYNAETYYNNTKWIAWFTSKIPINEGPFIFKNLPGVILELYDEGNNRKFKAIEIAKKSKNFCNTDKNSKEIDKEKYLKVINSRKETENSLLDSLMKIEGLNLGNKKIEKIDYDPMRDLIN